MAHQNASEFYFYIYGAGLPRQQSPKFLITKNSFQPFLHNFCCLEIENRSLLARAAVPVSSAVFPLGGASIIIAENPDAFGIFECPHLYWARNMFYFVPLIMISKHDFIKVAMGLGS